MKAWHQRLIGWTVLTILVLIVSLIVGYDGYYAQWQYTGPDGDGVQRRFSGSGLLIVLSPTMLIAAAGIKRTFYAWEHEFAPAERR